MVKRERDGRKRKKQWSEAGFLAEFGPNFFPAQTMKSTSIYRGWKRVILSSQGKPFNLDSVGKDPNR